MFCKYAIAWRTCKNQKITMSVIPAKAGIQSVLLELRRGWTPVFTGVTTCDDAIIT